MVMSRLASAVIVVLLALPVAGLAQCVDINADPLERLLTIVHIDEERAGQIVDGRPWPGVRALTGIHGIGRGRIRDIVDEGIACAGVRAQRGERETLSGVASVLDADTFEVAGEAGALDRYRCARRRPNVPCRRPRLAMRAGRDGRSLRDDRRRSGDVRGLRPRSLGACPGRVLPAWREHQRRHRFGRVARG